MVCRRHFTPLGKGWIELEATWQVNPTKEYRERALFGGGDSDALTCFSFTSDGKRSIGHLTQAPEVHEQAIAFEAEMPAGMARMLYWPLKDRYPGFHFAVESKTLKGWNRFLLQEFVVDIRCTQGK
jgi:hypothetical protein